MVMVIDSPRPLRLLSYNIQVGLHTRDYRHMISGAWRHVLPYRGRYANLERIAEVLADYDVIAIQEADAGSLRARTNQIEYLAQRAGFNHCGYTVTRDLRPVARHCLGWMSRTAPISQQFHSLPSQIPGRAAIRLDFGNDFADLTVLMAHLSLGAGDRRRQLDYLSKLVEKRDRLALLGDLNSGGDFLRAHDGLQARDLHPQQHAPKTYPSWRPQRALDQVLVTPDLEITRLEALPLVLSDHQPLAVDLQPKPRDP